MRIGDEVDTVNGNKVEGPNDATDRIKAASGRVTIVVRRKAPRPPPSSRPTTATQQAPAQQPQYAQAEARNYVTAVAAASATQQPPPPETTIAPTAQPPTAQPRFCNYCGYPIPPGAVFCGSCGKAVVRPSQSIVHPPEQQAAASTAATVQSPRAQPQEPFPIGTKVVIKRSNGNNSLCTVVKVPLGAGTFGSEDVFYTLQLDGSTSKNQFTRDQMRRATDADIAAIASSSSSRQRLRDRGRETPASPRQPPPQQQTVVQRQQAILDTIVQPPTQQAVAAMAVTTQAVANDTELEPEFEPEFDPETEIPIDREQEPEPNLIDLNPQEEPEAAPSQSATEMLADLVGNAERVAQMWSNAMSPRESGERSTAPVADLEVLGSRGYGPADGEYADGELYIV